MALVQQKNCYQAGRILLIFVEEKLLNDHFFFVVDFVLSD